MAQIPRATVRVESTAAAPGAGLDTVCILAPVPTNADMTPRIFGSAQAVYEEHGYSEGVEYAALHLAYTGKSFIFVGMPIGTAGAVSRSTGHENTGSCVVTATAGVDGVLNEHEGILRVVAGGTIGTDQIRLEVSLDGGRQFSPLRLGTASSYTLPYVGVTLSFAAGTLVTGDTVLEWHGSGPVVDTTDLAEVFTNLAADDKQFRSVVLIGDLDTDTKASAFLTVLNSYASSTERFTLGRASISDRLPQAFMSHVLGRLTGNPTLTFEEVGATGDTLTRSSGSWITDGFVVGDTVTVTGTASNNVSGPVTGVTATVLTFGSTDLAAEVIAVDAGPVVVVASPTLTFAEVGATGDTLTRNRGSWLTDGFRSGDTVSVTGTASNNVSGPVTGVTATVLTFGSTDLAAEVIKSSSVTVQTSQTKAAWMAAQDAEFASIDGSPRLDLGAGRAAAPSSPFSGWQYRRSPAWAASLIEYQHDVHVATWRKDLGPTGFDLFNADGELVEWDDRADGGAGSAANFTTFRTYSNGPRGAFIAQSLTRAGDGQLTQQTHNMHVVNVGCNTVQQATEQTIGRSLQLNDDGTATTESLKVIEAEVNAAVELALLTSRGEGPRASKAVWSADPSDVYNVPEPTMHGTLELLLNGTIHSVDTAVRLKANGAQ